MKRTVEIRTLKSFVVVAREGNISRAADVLNLTQPAISLQLKRLSEDTGLTLFSRTSRGVELTRDGANLLVKAEKVLTALSEFGETASRISGQVRGPLRIGTIVDPDFIRLGQFLARLVENYPEIRTELAHGMSGQVIARLMRNQIDAGYFLGDLNLVRDTKDHEMDDLEDIIHQVELTHITYRIIAPAGWEGLVSGKDISALAELPWIGTPPDSVHSRLLDRMFSEHGCKQTRVALVDQEPAMLAMVRSGVGLSLCQESIALEQRQTCGISIADKVRIDTPLSFVALRSRLTDPRVSVAFDVLGEIWNFPARTESAN